MSRTSNLVLAGLGLLLASTTSSFAQTRGEQCVPAVANPAQYRNCRIVVVGPNEICRCQIAPRAIGNVRDGDRQNNTLGLTNAPGFVGVTPPVRGGVQPPVGGVQPPVGGVQPPVRGGNNNPPTQSAGLGNPGNDKEKGRATEGPGPHNPIDFGYGSSNPTTYDPSRESGGSYGRGDASSPGSPGGSSSSDQGSANSSGQGSANSSGQGSANSSGQGSANSSGPSGADGPGNSENSNGRNG